MRKIAINELRVGNWIINPDDENKMYQIQNGWEIDEGPTYEPIPLTEEWLTKLGFHDKYKSVHNHWYKTYGEGPPYALFELDQKSDVDDDNNSIPQEEVFYWNMRLDVQFVHQLQNLYYAITQAELTIS